MAEHQRFGPKVNHQRPFIRDPNRSEWVRDDLPTKTVKRGAWIASASADDLLGSHTVSGTATMRLTYLHFAGMPEAGTTIMYLADRDGTFDYPVFGDGERKSITMMGDGKSPIHTVKGSFSIRARNAIAAGSTVLAWEGIES